MVAWINIPDNTKIDYPVMWTPEDENYYLHRSFEKEELYEGCLILDTDSKAEPATTNLIIHGHNMRSGSMFGELDKYSDENYCKEHDTIYLFTESEKRSYKVMAVFKSAVYKKSDTRFKYYKFFNADTEEQFDDFYNNVKDMSLYDTGVTASFGDRFLTLSTCSKHVENGRFVVVAKETESEACYNSFR
ncbi:MAG: class B sortase [Lachnospiraceae bacterium]|nr:class B sortase [Lachnospiraceae bacterium]